MSVYDYSIDNTYNAQVAIWGPTGTQGGVGYHFWGSYYDDQNHTNTGPTAANVVPINNTFTQYFVNAVNNEVVVNFTNVYRYSFSLHFQNTSSSEQYVDVWLRINDVDVPHSNSSFGVTRRTGSTNGRLIAVTDYILPLGGGDRLKLMWHANSTDIILLALPAVGSGPPRPSTPSVIINIANI